MDFQPSRLNVDGDGSGIEAYVWIDIIHHQGAILHAIAHDDAQILDRLIAAHLSEEADHKLAADDAKIVGRLYDRKPGAAIRHYFEKAGKRGDEARVTILQLPLPRRTPLPSVVSLAGPW